MEVTNGRRRFKHSRNNTRQYDTRHKGTGENKNVYKGLMYKKKLYV